MADLAEKWTGHDDRQATELSFTSAGGFRLAIRQSARIPRAYLSTALMDPVVTSIDVAELATLKLSIRSGARNTPQQVTLRRHPWTAFKLETQAWKAYD